MAAPTIVEISHALGREEARRRLASRVGELASHLPSGVADIKTDWLSEYRLALALTAMAQKIAATVDVEEHVLRVTLELPALLGIFSGAIADAVRQQGGKLLLADH